MLGTLMEYDSSLTLEAKDNVVWHKGVTILAVQIK